MLATWYLTTHVFLVDHFSSWWLIRFLSLGGGKHKIPIFFSKFVMPTIELSVVINLESWYIRETAFFQQWKKK